MNKIVRIILVFISCITSYMFVYWVPFSFIPVAREIPFLPDVGSLIIAVGLGVFIWKATGVSSKGLGRYILMGGIVLGSIGFILGFFGPLILSPSANQGPLLGIFITGPLGFVVGLVGGGLFWLVKVRNETLS